MSNNKATSNNSPSVLTVGSEALHAASVGAEVGFSQAVGEVLAFCKAKLGASQAALIDTSAEKPNVIAAVDAEGKIGLEGHQSVIPEATTTQWVATLDQDNKTDNATLASQPYFLGDSPAGVVVFAWDQAVASPSSEERSALIEACAQWASCEWSRRIEMDRRDELADQRHRAMVKGSADGLFEWDLVTNRVDYSPSWKRMFGFEEADDLHKPDAWLDLVESSDSAQLEADMAMCLAGQTPSLRNQHRIITPSGQTKWMLCRAEPVYGETGEPVYLVGSLSDTTEFKVAEEKLRHAAEHDKLTNLPNRATLHMRLDQAIRRRKLTGGRREYALMFLDFDRFKVINDSLGHDAGDQLLIQIAERLGQQIRTTDTAARIGGDEFVILLEEVESFDAVVKIADRLLDVFAKPFNIDGNEVTSTASIGIVEGKTEYTQADDVIRDADSAMYHAKSLGKARYSIFDQDMQDESLKRLGLERDLRQAIGTDQIFMVYQPIVSVEDGSTVGFEALVRWNHPEFGFIRPDQFIDIAEESGLIVPLGRWILQSSCLGLKAICKEVPGQPLTMNVNLSRRQLVQPDIVDMIDEVVREAGVDPSQIKLEITESVIMDSRIAVTKVLESLRSLGFALAMDDFGTGYSSLSCLHEFPIDVLKIDRSFVLNLEERVEFAAVIQAVVTLAHTLKMSVVAEGIETTDQLVVLQSLECDHLQGYLFSKPLPLGEVIAFLQNTDTMRLSA